MQIDMTILIDGNLLKAAPFAILIALWVILMLIGPARRNLLRPKQ